jgi:hypothetical protein
VLEYKFNLDGLLENKKTPLFSPTIKRNKTAFKKTQRPLEQY